MAAAVGHYSLQSCRRALRAIAWPHLRLVAHLGDGRWRDADTGYWRSDRGQRVAVRGRLDMASVRTTYVVLACAHLDHDPAHNLPNNLAALCQRCRMLHDAAEHRWQRWWNVFRLCALRDLYKDPRLTRQRLDAIRRRREGSPQLRAAFRSRMLAHIPFFRAQVVRPDLRLAVTASSRLVERLYYNAGA